MAVRDTTARIKINNKHFEISVDLDYALRLRKGDNVNIQNVLLVNEIFTNLKDGSKASSSDLTACFGTSDVLAVADRIVKKGEIQLPKDFRDEQSENKRKQIIEWIVKNTADAKTGRPFTSQIIESAMAQAGTSINNSPVDQQVLSITESLKTILPIKIETKKLAITIPAIYTGKVYGIFNQYKEKEDWLNNGDLKVVVNIPIGMQLDFFDKLNAVTHGAALSQEIK